MNAPGDGASSSACGVAVQRKRRRVKPRCVIVLYRRGQPVGVEATAKQISKDGCYCVTKELFAPFEELECKVSMPIEGVGQLVLNCEAEVLRVVANGRRSGYRVHLRLGKYTGGRIAR